MRGICVTGRGALGLSLVGANSRYMLFPLAMTNFGTSKSELRGLSQLWLSILFLLLGLRARPALDKCTSFLGAGAELGLGIPHKKQEILRQKRRWSPGIGTVPRWELISDTCFFPLAMTNFGTSKCKLRGLSQL